MTKVPNGFWDESIFEELEEMEEYKVLPERPDGLGITVIEYAERANCSTDNARCILEKAAKNKVLVKVMMRVNRKQTGVFMRSKDLETIK